MGPAPPREPAGEVAGNGHIWAASCGWVRPAGARWSSSQTSLQQPPGPLG